MLIKEIIELAQRLPDGGVISDRTRYDGGYIESTIGLFRSRILKLVYQKNKRINPVCYQKHWPEFEKDLQDDNCCVKFRHPEVISLDDQSDGFRYIGALEFAKAYPRINSRAWLSTVNDNRVMAANNNRRATVLYDGNLQILEVRGLPLLEEIMTESILADPLSVPTFNKIYDQYPFPNDLIPDLMQMMMQEQIAVEAAKPITPNSVPLKPNRTR